MSSGTIVAIVIIVVIVAAVIIAIAAAGARRRRLQQRFGPEYDRAVADTGSRRRAEAELTEREKRVRELDIRPLDPAARDRYKDQWTAIQQQFVDAPEKAITEAQKLIVVVMDERGYPTDDTGQIMSDLSVDHAATLEHFRTAQALGARAADGTANTEEMRQAMVHYRALFRDLLGEADDTTLAAEAAQPAETTGTAGGAVPAGAADSAVPTRTVPATAGQNQSPPNGAAASSANPDDTMPDGHDTGTQRVPAYRSSGTDATDSSASDPTAQRPSQER
jgi:hypothetical protein